MADQPSYYELLGITPSASGKEIEVAYRALARTAHPDTGGNAGLFRLIKMAHDTLGDAARRAAYDRSLGLADDLDGLTAPLDLLTLAQAESEKGNLGRARSAFQAVVAAGTSEWTALAWLGLAGVEAEGGNLGAAHRAYGTAIQTGDPAVLASALVGLGDVERELGHEADARHAYQLAIGTGDDQMIPSALLSLAELEEASGNHVAARAAYQLTIRSGDPEFAQMALDALTDLP